MSRLMQAIPGRVVAWLWGVAVACALTLATQALLFGGLPPWVGRVWIVYVLWLVFFTFLWGLFQGYTREI